MNEYTTNTAKHAQIEFEILKSVVDQPIIAPFEKEILQLCEKFGLSGQSGGSAPMTAAAIADAVKTLLSQRPICAITGIDQEWVDVTEMAGSETTVWQNKRDGRLFKNSEGRVRAIDAIIFKTQNGGQISSNGGAFMPDGTKVSSHQLVPAFPFKHKTFYIDVIEKEVAKDDWQMYVKDEAQVDKVWKYYTRNFE